MVLLFWKAMKSFVIVSDFDEFFNNCSDAAYLGVWAEIHLVCTYLDGLGAFGLFFCFSWILVLGKSLFLYHSSRSPSL